MKAVLLKNTGEVSQLVIENIPQPEIAPDELLIKTKAFAINPLEIKTRKGNVFSEKLLADPPSILGWDASGMVAKTGAAVQNFASGDKVFGVIGFPNFGKTYAEYFVAKEKDLCHIPENLDFEEAAVSTIAALTAYQALENHAALQPGEKILIHGASGGVGHFAVQLAKHYGAEVYATASGKKQTFVEQLGADHFIDYTTQNFETEAREMDVVFDMIGGEYIDRSLNILKKGGTIISIPSVNNAEVEAKAAAKDRIGVRFIMNAHQPDMEKVAELLKNGVLKPFIFQRFSLEEIREAHTTMENGHTQGRIVVGLE